jgi:hypothetical protein
VEGALAVLHRRNEPHHRGGSGEEPGQQPQTGVPNPYLALFTPERAVPTMAALADVQFAFDDAIQRTDLIEAKVGASLTTLRGIVK